MSRTGNQLSGPVLSGRPRRGRVAAVGVACSLALVLTACGDDGGGGVGYGGDEGAEGAASLDQVRIVVPTSAGGGLDTTFRQFQPAFEEELGADVVVENVEGGNTVIGGREVSDLDDCSALLAQAIPHLIFSYMTNEAGYDLSSFSAVGGLTIEPSVIRVADDAPWQTIEELVEDARSRPGEITFSVSERASSNNIALLRIEEALGVDFNIVPFGGGGPARAALVAGEVDATHAGIFGSLGIAEDSRALAVDEPENRWPEITDDAPTLNEALDLDREGSGSTYQLWASSGCEENHPEVYSDITEAVEAALQNEDYLAELESVGEQDKVNYVAPDDLMENAQSTEDEIRQLLENDPDVFLD